MPRTGHRKAQGSGAIQRSRITHRFSYEAAFAEVLPEIQAVEDDDLEAINVDVVGTVALVLGVLPELRGLRAQ